MKTTLSPEIQQVMDAVPYRPAVTMILPVETHNVLNNETEHMLKTAADKAQRKLQQRYPDEQCQLVMQKLHMLIAGINVPAGKKGIAIYVSPIFERVLYLDCEVTEKLSINDHFDIRDLVYGVKQSIHFFLLIVSARESKLFKGTADALVPMPMVIPASVEAYVTDAPERVENFTDMTEHKHQTVDKFLHHIDLALTNLLHTQPLPVLLFGPQEILGQYKKLSRHTEGISGYTVGNYEEATIPELLQLIQPHLNALKLKKQALLMSRIDEANGQQRLAVGIFEVWQAAYEGKGKLVIVEEGYRFMAKHGPEASVIEPLTQPDTDLAMIPDAVANVIAQVLDSGGDVEFVADGALAGMGHIVLIKYYE